MYIPKARGVLGPLTFWRRTVHLPAKPLGNNKDAASVWVILHFWWRPAALGEFMLWTTPKEVAFMFWNFQTLPIFKILQALPTASSSRQPSFPAPTSVPCALLGGPAHRPDRNSNIFLFQTLIRRHFPYTIFPVTFDPRLRSIQTLIATKKGWETR